MKKFFILLLITLGIPFAVLAQQAGLNVQLNPVTGTKTDYRFDLTLNLTVSPDNGIEIVLPASLKPVLVQFLLNGKDLWLKNGSAIPQADSVVVWQADSEGLRLLYRSGLLGQNDNIQIRCMVNIHDDTLSGNPVVLKELVPQPSGESISGESFISGTVPSIANR